MNSHHMMSIDEYYNLINTYIIHTLIPLISRQAEPSDQLISMLPMSMLTDDSYLQLSGRISALQVLIILLLFICYNI